MAPVRPVDEGTITVDDGGPADGGRTIGYRWFGAVRGPGTDVVLYCHGGLSCGADAALGHGAARERDVAILAVDRPGVAASGPRPGRTTADFAADAESVLDALEVARTAGVVGWSLGGQYALAVAALAPARAPACAVVAGVPPLSRPGVVRSLGVVDRVLLKAVDDGVPPTIGRLPFRLTHVQAARTYRRRVASGDQRSVGHLERQTWGAADGAVLGGPEGRVIDEAVDEGTQSLDAMLEEYRAWSRDWGFALGDVAVPVTIWQGDQDHLVPAHLAQQLADALPRAAVRSCRGEGHLLLARHWGDVLDAL